MTNLRTYKIQEDIKGTPILTVKGKFLEEKFGISAGNQVRLLEGKHILVFIKVPAAETEYNRNQQRLAVCEKEAAYLRSVLLDSVSKNPILQKVGVHNGTII